VYPTERTQQPQNRPMRLIGKIDASGPLPDENNAGV
jgi:hypothetical protein